MNDTNEVAKEYPPIELAAYFALDVSPDGEIAKDLMNRLEREAESNEVVLENIVGNLPADVTSQTSAWYQLRVQSVRTPALQALCRLYAERTTEDHGDGFLPQSRQAQIDEDLLKGRLQCYQTQREKFHTTAEKIAKLKADIERKQHDYRVLSTDLGREARPLNRPLYFGVLIVVLFGSEAAINLDAFKSLPWASPAIAWGATILIGLAIGLAAHFHGTVLKQFDYWLGPQVDDTKRGAAIRMIAAGTAALLLALSFVYYARSAYFTTYMMSLSSFGQPMQHGGSFLWVVGGSLIGNIIVYLVGCMWAFLMHDQNPHFVELKQDIDTFTAQCDSLTKSMDASRRREIEQLTAIHKRKTEETKTATAQILAQPSLRWPQQMLAEFRAKDAQVVALMTNYRQALIHAIGSRSKHVQFIAACDDPHKKMTHLTISEFQHRPITLKFL